MSLADTVAMHGMGIEMDRVNGAMAIIGGDNGVDTIYDACAAFMASAGSMPLVATEPWEEGDQAYAKRLGVPQHVYLDRGGTHLGLPRARLVLAEREP